jgi:hypothetical protein
MKIPDMVKIAGQIFRIIYSNRLASSRTEFGNSSRMEGTIELDSTQPIGHQESTFIHEIIEVINAENELNMKHNQITCLATQLHGVIKDNLSMFKGGE